MNAQTKIRKPRKVIKPHQEGMIRVGANGNGLQVVIPKTHQCWPFLEAKKGITGALLMNKGRLMIILTFSSAPGSFWKEPRERNWRNEDDPGPVEMDIQMTYVEAFRGRDENIKNFDLAGKGWGKVPCREHYIGEDRVELWAPDPDKRKPPRFTNRGVVEDLKDKRQTSFLDDSTRELRLRKSQIIDDEPQ